MKIYKWVPISTLEQKKKLTKSTVDKENGLPRKTGVDSSNSNFGLTEDSNTCKINFGLIILFYLKLFFFFS